MAPSTRFERVTYRLGGDCSIQLSYEGERRIISVVISVISKELMADHNLPSAGIFWGYALNSFRNRS